MKDPAEERAPGITCNDSGKLDITNDVEPGTDNVTDNE